MAVGGVAIPPALIGTLAGLIVYQGVKKFIVEPAIAPVLLKGAEKLLQNSDQMLTVMGY